MPSSADAPLAVALGANRPSAAGNPRQTLISVRPRLEAVIGDWARQSLRFRWSALLDTAPVGPVDQPRYLNGVLVVEGIPSEPNQAAALRLLDDLHALEQHFGRDRAGEERWGPRTLDLDLLFWGELRLDHPRLVLPHPRLHLRAFVMEPLLQAMQTTTTWC
ncbi:MAG: 2-amino-4-hydroxy-6-hydroxymethyldihydropteridine diphosphokinase [Synechococcus sp. MED850]|jgi:2-amino-4-hydroxy-6-hydroxymethyldihydropteridine diphosphokinase|nr:2-amino-4-hydroxy-6-hydroxymethyldihydropteridine diphosphokinase [Synechococcus sp. MED850]